MQESRWSALDVCVVVRGRRSRESWGGWPSRLGEVADSRLLARDPDALARSELSTASPSLLFDEVETTADAARVLADRDLDIVLALETPSSGLELCGAHGVWSVVFGDADDGTAGPRYFWELHDRSPVSRAAIRADDAVSSRILYRSSSSTEPVSPHRNESIAAWKLGRALLLRLRELHVGGQESLMGHAENVEPAQQPSPVRPIRLPDVARVCRRVARSGFMRFLDRWFWRGEWFVAYRMGDGWPPWHGPSPHTLLQPPRGRFLADPFLLEREGRHFLFVEDFVEAEGKAVISWLELGGNGPTREPRRALERDYHLSYPFVFESADEVYMVPETAAARQIELYRADPFPDNWTLVRVLLRDVVADDATLLEHDGRFWLFVSMAPDGTSSIHGELFLFWADSLASDWVPHPWNPVVSDVRSARPAGRIFAHEGAWIRPSQDCSRRYGYATVFNRIEELTTRVYRESPIARVGPEWLDGNLGTHTYGRDGVFETVDGYRRSRRRLRRDARA